MSTHLTASTSGESEASRCPMSQIDAEFTPFDSPYLDFPYQVFERARAEAPVFFSSEIKHWVVSKYDDVRTVMRDVDRFSAVNAQSPITPWPKDTVDEFNSHGFGLRPNLSNNDAPSHTHVRHFLRDAFSVRRIGWLEPHVRRLVETCVDKFAGDLSCDLIEKMLADVPAQVLFLFLGIPDADIETVKRWSAGRAILTWGRPSDEEVREQLPDFINYLQYCFDLVETLEKNPGEDYTSELLRRLSEEQPEDFDKGRIAQTLFGLLMAGHETTTNQSANAIRAILSTPGTWDRLANDPTLIPNAVEESIRFESSVIAWRRTTKCPVVLSGVEIPAGAEVMTLLGSANRDEALFEDPNRLNIDRENARNHVSFGYGAHYCLGAPLARLELRIFLDVLTKRLHGLQLVPTTYLYSPNTSHRGPLSLPVEWKSAD